MTLMIFINAIQLFHTHADVNRSRSVVAAKLKFPHQDISQSNRCPICEFNLVKDADLTHADIPLFVRASRTILFNSPITLSLHQFAILSKGRAPPSLLS
jgi:hypothetical protein